MAFKTKIKIGQKEFDAIARIRNVRFDNANFPSKFEIEYFPDEATYKQIKDQERGFLLNEDGTPKEIPSKKDPEKKVKVGVPVTLKIEDALLAKKVVFSRDFEKDLELREKLFQTLYSTLFSTEEKI